MSGLAWVPIRSTSAKPRVSATAVGAPRRSSSALVATVVPMRTVHGGTESSGPRPSSRRIPSTGAKSEDSTFVTFTCPSGPSPMQSVKVPPRSMKNAQLTSRPALPRTRGAWSP